MTMAQGLTMIAKNHTSKASVTHLEAGNTGGCSAEV
jgi:hypothetical protein